jgi:hypothetical protein
LLHTSAEELLVSFSAQAKAPDIHVLSLCVSKEDLRASFNDENQVPDDSHDQHHQCTPCIFVENPRYCRQVFARLPTKHDIPHLSSQLVSQDSVQVWFVSTGVVCFHSVGLGGSWTFMVISTSILVVPPYLFLCIYPLSKWYMMSDSLYSFTNFRVQYSSL